jgi:hypothetical protein
MFILRENSQNVVIEPFTTIHINVVIGDGTWIGLMLPLWKAQELEKIVIYFLVQLYSTGFKVWRRGFTGYHW